MDGVTIRPATMADLHRIHAIYNDAVLTGTATWDYEPWAWPTRLAWWEEHQEDPTCPVFVAEGAGEVLGFSYLSWFRTKIGYRFTREDTIYVDPAHHGRGLGRLLLARVVEAARDDGMHAVIGGIEASNAASLALHASLGFVEVARLPQVGYKFERWLDLVLMQLTLE